MADLDERTEREAEKIKEQAPVEERQELSDRLQSKNTQKGSELEQKTNQTFFKTLKKFTPWDWVKIGATTTTALVMGGPITWASVMGSYLLAYGAVNKGKIKYNDLKSEIHLANTMAAFLTKLYGYINYFTTPISKSLFALGIAVPVFNAFFLPVQYIIRKYTPSSFIKDVVTGRILKLPSEIYRKTLKPDFGRSLKNIYLYLSIPLVISINYLKTIPAQIASVSAIRFFYRYLMGKSTEAKPTYSPKYKPAYQPDYKPA